MEERSVLTKFVIVTEIYILLLNFLWNMAYSHRTSVWHYLLDVPSCNLTAAI